MVSIYPVVKAMHHIYIYIYISVYLPVKGNTRISLKESTFFEVEISTPLEGLKPTISLLHTKFHYSSCLRSSKQVISNIFLYIRVSNKEIVYENDKKIWIEYVRWRPFEFYDLWENGVIYSLAYGRNGFSTKFSYRNNKCIFPQKCLQVFI